MILINQNWLLERKVMLVKKINDEWAPAENPGLKIGETVEITDPKELLENKMVVAIGTSGEELTAFDLYGSPDKSEIEEFRKFRELKNQQKNQERLKEEQEKMKKQLKALELVEKQMEEKTENPVVEPVVVEDEKVKKEETYQKRLKALAKAREARKVNKK